MSTIRAPTFDECYLRVRLRYRDEGIALNVRPSYQGGRRVDIGAHHTSRSTAAPEYKLFFAEAASKIQFGYWETPALASVTVVVIAIN
ncbi:hypothetical protein CT0861_08386 [Colletotrichum tofieldiae]|uniref:Uncharacterized protein n=1 Tax=Colletotrichum tofieldiae TaxID=708197 RepID=A0A166WVP8_9PEZI|nr:hypothetical protein CT0861_08386 [Colletotrichum tofieldiae]